MRQITQIIQIHVILFCALLLTGCNPGNTETDPVIVEHNNLDINNLADEDIFVFESSPSFLLFSFPAANQVLTKSEFLQGSTSLGWGANLPGICISLDVVVDTEVSYGSTEEWIDQHVSLFLNSEKLQINSILLTDSSSHAVTRVNEDSGDEITIGKTLDGSPTRVCFEGETTSVEEYLVTLKVSNLAEYDTSVSYTWRFTVE